MEYLEEEGESVLHGRFGRAKFAAKTLTKLSSFLDKEKAPKQATYKMIYNVLIKGDFNSTAEFHRNTLFIGVMHFQDAYNFDVERVSRCGIHYALPDGRVVPFCSYNTIYRDEFEKEHSSPL